jgi:hypothetical protein
MAPPERCGGSLPHKVAAYDCFSGVASGAPWTGCVTGSVSGIAGVAFSSTGFSGVVVEGFGFVIGNIPFNITAIFYRYILGHAHQFILQ